MDFYKGPSKSYDKDVHGDGIYFCVDTQIIKMGGDDYIGPIAGKKVVSRITAATSFFKIVYVDGTIDNVPMQKTVYYSAINDKETAMEQAVGGFPKGTTVGEVEGKTFSEVIDRLLFPTIKPTFRAPSALISLSGYDALQEVGVPAPTSSDFITGLSRGSIILGSKVQGDRSGFLNKSESFIYVGGNPANKIFPSVIEMGETSFTYRAAYHEGPQPYDSEGNPFETPLPAGYVDSHPVIVQGTLPWFASTKEATDETPVVKQPLIPWSHLAGSMNTGRFEVQPSGSLPQVFKLPRQIQTLQMLNTISGQMETVGLEDYEETTEKITGNGVARTYYVYTYVGPIRGRVTLAVKF